jgi:hypothetical protein
MGPYSAGSTITYNLTVANTGNEDLTDVQISDPDAIVSGGPLAVLTVGATDSTTFSASYTATPEDAVAGIFTNTASVSGVGAVSQVEVSDIDDETVLIVVSGSPELTLVKELISDPNGFYGEGDILEYRVTATNSGNVPLTNVVVNDPQLVPTTETCATLAVGAICVLEGSHTITAEEATALEVVNTATAQSNETGPVSDTVTQLLFERKCGRLPEEILERVLTSSSNPQTNALGFTYNIDSVHDYVTANGTVVASLTTTAVADEYDQIDPDFAIVDRTDIDALFKDPTNPERYFYSENASQIALAGNPIGRTVWNWDLNFEQVVSTSLDGCDSIENSTVFIIDIDNDTILRNISRPWDREEAVGGAGTGYTETTPGEFIFATQANMYLYWDAVNINQNVSYEYDQSQGDAKALGAEVRIERAVNYYCDAAGEIVYAETFEGSLDSTEWNDITEVV